MTENLDHAVAKRNGDETIILTRRAALFGAATVAITSAAITQATAVEQIPTREEMEDYFLFLWAEHRRVAEELGIEVFDHLTFRMRGGQVRYDLACTSPAASRALRVLAEAGLKGGAA